MHQPTPDPKTPIFAPGRVIDRELLASMGIELADLAREKGKLTLSLECLSFVAEIQGFFDDTDGL